MANDLTGDFDVVVEFGIPAANRVLAGMHRSQRFLHSVSLQVDDRSRPGGTRPPNTVSEVLDRFGDAVGDHHRIPPVGPLRGGVAAASPIVATVAPVVNPDDLVLSNDPIVPSNLHGRAQLQIAAPTLELVPGPSSRVVAKMKVMARYLADAGSSGLAEYIRGELALTAPLEHAASQVGNVLEIGLQASDVGITFSTAFTSRPLSAPDLAGINQLIRNAVRTSLLPSSTTIPTAIHRVQVKTLPGPPPVIAVLLNLARQAPQVPTVGNPASVTGVFLTPGDDFAFGVGRDFIVSAFDPIVDSILSQPLAPIHFSVSLGIGSVDVTYTMKLNSATVALETGRIRLTIKGHAHTPSSWLPDFDFTVLQDFGLEARLGSADLVVGDVSIDTSSRVADLFKNRALPQIKANRDRALQDSHAFTQVRRLLGADENLGRLFDALLTPPTAPDGTVPDRADVRLDYTQADIRPTGVVLHGSLALTEWPAAVAEIEPLPAAPGSPLGTTTTDLFSRSADYTALKSWIPGGAIERYEWTRLGQAQPLVDENRFVLVHPGPETTGAIAFMAGPVTPYEPYCVTVRGSRLSSAGPVVAQPVSATTCAYNSVSLLNAGALGAKSLPMVPLARPGAGGLVEITGHAAARVDRTGRDTPSRIVHFADDTTAGQLDVLVRALHDGRPKEGGAAAVLAVLAPERLRRARYTPGIVYLEDEGSAWEQAFGLESVRRPSTLILDPGGRAVWRHDGPLDGAELAAAVRAHLPPGRPVSLRALRLDLRIGRPAPDFLFEPVPGRQITLRKVVGRPVLLGFWKTSSPASLEALHDADRAGAQPGGPLVLAIADGDSADTARKVAAAHGLAATLVADPRRRISSAYGVAVWPTTVYVDATSRVRSIEYGGEPRGKDHA